MDEKSQLEPETQSKLASTADNANGSVETNDQNSLSLENLSDKSESKSLEKKLSSLDMNTKDAPQAIAAESDEISKKMLETESAEESTEESSGISAETEEPVEAMIDTLSDTADRAQAEKIQGSLEEKAATKEAAEHQENSGDAAAGDHDEQASGGADDFHGQEQTFDPSQCKPIEASGGKRSVLKVAGSALAIVALFGGFFIFNNKSDVNTNATAAETRESRVISQNQKKKALKNIKPPAPEANRMYRAKLQAISALRDTLLNKQEEVQRLKVQYQDGIERLENEISDELQDGQISTLSQAMENKSVAFALRTIQRRQAYIKQLEKPSEWISSACEELLYIKRRTLMDIQIAEIAGGIDMNKHIERIDAAIRNYQPTADRLALDMTHSALVPLEIIWERILDQTRQNSSVQVHSRNRIVSEQICKGNFDRLSEISEISPETAKCLAEMQGPGLFLNGLSEISPGAARRLFQWKGSWICLNGIRALSPRVAHYLFQWDGNWISLNGLTEFPTEIGERLLQWEGQQLELMGLQYVEGFPEKIALEYLAQWERSGGKLFVTKSVRKKIDELNREPA